MSQVNRNTWRAKIRRTFTSVLPVSKYRRGECTDCGACCKLPNNCPLLRFREDGTSYCGSYRLRPLNCRKYPRTASENVTADVCTYYFELPLPKKQKRS